MKENIASVGIFWAASNIKTCFQVAGTIQMFVIMLFKRLELIGVSRFVQQFSNVRALGQCCVTFLALSSWSHDGCHSTRHHTVPYIIHSQKEEI